MFKNRKRIAQLTEDNITLKEKVDDLNERLKELEGLFGEDFEALDVEKSRATEKDEPWVGFSLVDTKGDDVGIKLDWNPQFIDYLNKNGIRSSNEEDAVGIWFAGLVRDMGEEISEEEARRMGY